MLKTIASTIIAASLFATSADAQGLSGSGSTTGGSAGNDPGIVIDVLRADVDRDVLTPYGRCVKWGDGEVTITGSTGKVKADLKSGAVTFEGAGLVSLVGSITAGGDDNGNGNASLKIYGGMGMGPGDFSASAEVLVRRSVSLSDLPGSSQDNKLAAVTVAIVASFSEIEASLKRGPLASTTSASGSSGAGGSF